MCPLIERAALAGSVVLIETRGRGLAARLRTGITIDDYVTRPAKVTQLNDHKFKIVLTEGRHHQIRRMCDTFGFTVRSLKRERIMNIKLTGLAQGQQKQLGGAELKLFLKNLGL